MGVARAGFGGTKLLVSHFQAGQERLTESLLLMSLEGQDPPRPSQTRYSCRRLLTTIIEARAVLIRLHLKSLSHDKQCYSSSS
jgi:hypothetical protein